MEKTDLLVSTTNRNLERKILIFGFEIFDTLIIAIVLSTLNFLFKNISYKIPIIWGGTFLFSLILYFSKRNKPENFLIHKIRYWFNPAIFYAGSFDLKQTPYIKK